ncbi:MAG: hydrogenase nickel incorporation protein HypA/HybF [Solirubrobacteraceae bacterium]|nr:hydrogenase nickel incorporation protein HypA/HybF [Solirubrobacteraceae bacterium]
MHELSLASAIVNTAAKHAGGCPVAVVSLRVGKLRQVVPDTLEFYFEFVARDSVCEGARLEQEVIDAVLRCRPCAYEWAIEIPAFRCPVCGGSDVEIASGDEFEVESIQIEPTTSAWRDREPTTSAWRDRPGGDLGEPASIAKEEEAACIAPR